MNVLISRNQDASSDTARAEIEKAQELVLGGLVPFSTSDYPGKLAAVVFLQGCPWRCRYCHNPHLQPRNKGSLDLEWNDLLAFLKKRAGFLDAVVFSGGEPCYQDGLAEAIRSVKSLGYEIGLHTAGAEPERFKKILPLLDWVGLDIKALPQDYASVTCIAGSGAAPFQALKALIDSGIEYEVRTTVHTKLIDEKSLLKLATILSEAGVDTYSLQIFRTNGCLDEDLNSERVKLSSSTIDQLSRLFTRFTLRD